MEHEGTLSSPSQYIEHHLSFNTQGAEASFWTLHMATMPKMTDMMSVSICNVQKEASAPCVLKLR